jgi:putative membrane protein
MRFIRVVIGAFLLLLLVVFAVANRQSVAVSLDPLPFAIDLPLYLLVFAIFLLGLVLGALGQWLGGLGRKPAKAVPPSPPAPLSPDRG